MDHSNEEAILSPNGSLVKQIKSQRIQPSVAQNLPAFYRNVEEALDGRRATQSLFSIVNNNWQTNNAVDFCSNDYLSWNTTGLIRSSFLDELSRYPDFSVAAGGSRVMEGNYPYIEETELEIAAYHGAEQGLIVNSAFDANVMVWSALPRPGDAIVYDSLVHASTHEGMERSLAIQRTEFQHNDIKAFRNTLASILDSQPLIKQGRRSILVAVESVYSMEGDVCPLLELVEVADEVSQGLGNIQFVVDETHSAGLIGPNGTGLVCELGLETDVAVRLHTYSKAMGACGGIILSNELIKSALINFARPTIYSASPPFPFVAAIRAGHRLLGTPEALKGQESIQFLARTFFESLTTHPLWPTAQKRGILSVPLATGWEERPFLTHIVTIWTRQKYTYWIYMHLLSASFFVLPVKQPIVPSGESRLRVTFHAKNTAAQVIGLVDQIFAWLEEIMAIEDGMAEQKVTKAAREVYAWMKREGLKGFGMV
ncbi:putative aminotransferase [Cucurbitaria berberidis CBS 394.84]|uniref:Aminotransferase n=1 Tax=Cucurbitaria berberidis CBS 394.84 TaxID=1168544 RepID=A0A9P4LF52_9PLEO|nr:putative aminotransferase [Cucurbitaria berberidis CBS 394.84]KAF1852052.1 putative aminotransferase [Cucurbitaria berberidis CBS 394.84]